VSALALGCAGDAESESGPPQAETLTTLTPTELLAGIDAVVVLMMENRSFDHYLGSLRSDMGYPGRAAVDGLRGDETNPDPAGKLVKVFRTSNRTPKDPPHGWGACHAQWNIGKNDGFIQQHAAAGAGSEQTEVMGYHDRTSIPFYYSLADRYTVCDRWFASVLGPTWPNRYYLHAGTSFGKKDNSPIFDGRVQTVWDRLRAKGVSGKNYQGGLAAFYSGGFIGKVLTGKSPVARLEKFFQDAAAGTLPAFSMIDPDFTTNDDHPSHDIQLGQAFMATIVQAIAKSPQWPRTLLCITYDEHGGFFDHVPPPTIADDRAEFRQLGFRVPALCIGATVKAGQVNHTLFNHVSVAATLKTRFGIDSLGTRMDASADLSSCIDPALVHSPAAPPLDLPKVKVSLAAAEARVATAETSQPELHGLAASRAIPSHELDDRPAIERLAAWLEQGERLGAVELE